MPNSAKTYPSTPTENTSEIRPYLAPIQGKTAAVRPKTESREVGRDVPLSGKSCSSGHLIPICEYCNPEVRSGRFACLICAPSESGDVQHYLPNVVARSKSGTMLRHFRLSSIIASGQLADAWGTLTIGERRTIVRASQSRGLSADAWIAGWVEEDAAEHGQSVLRPWGVTL